MSKVEETRQALFDAIVPEDSLGYDGAADKIRAFEQAVRDEEFRFHEMKEDCRWNGGLGSDGRCMDCPLENTRYCP